MPLFDSDTTLLPFGGENLTPNRYRPLNFPFGNSVAWVFRCCCLGTSNGLSVDVGGGFVPAAATDSDLGRWGDRRQEPQSDGWCLCMRASRVGGAVGTRSRIGAVGAAAFLAIALSSTTASAGVDNTSSIVDSKGHRIEVLQMDTVIRTVPPLDSSPLSVEFFHDGVAGVKIDGPGVDGFTGTKLTIGYQIGYPIALTGGTVTLNSPNLDWALTSDNHLNVGIVPNPTLDLNVGGTAGIGGNIIPSQQLDINLAPGGITDVPLLTDQSFDGPQATVRLAGIHGYVQGAVGPVTIRPYAKAVTSSGDTVVTYGVSQRL